MSSPFCYPLYSYYLSGIICGPLWGSLAVLGSFAVLFGDHLRSGIICGLGIICGAVQFDSRSSLNFFQVSSFQLLKLQHLHCDDLHIIQIYDYFIYSYSFLHLRDKYELTIDQFPAGLIAQLVRALHRYRRGHGFHPRSSLNFFRFLLFNCLS